MAALSHTHESATLLAFPGMARDFSSGTIAAALRRHRLPERLTTQLLRAAAGAPDPRIALARALSARMMHAWGSFARSGQAGFADGGQPWPRLRLAQRQAHVWSEPPSPALHRFDDAAGRCARWHGLLLQ